jgi:hypothetical protein
MNFVESNSTLKFSSGDMPAQPAVHLSHLPDSMDSVQSQPPSLPVSSGEDMPPRHHQSQEIFKNAHNFNIMGANFIDNNSGNCEQYTIWIDSRALNVYLC